VLYPCDNGGLSQGRYRRSSQGLLEAIFVDDNDLITEAPAQHFSDRKGVLQTSSLKSNILPSVTRKYVIQGRDNIGLKTVERR